MYIIVSHTDRQNASISSGTVAENQPAVLFEYDQVGSFNGHPLYHGNQFGLDFHLYFRKTGMSSDGWTIAMDPRSNLYSVTTRNTASCPDGVKVGYDRNKFEDASFRMSCSEDIALEYVDGTGGAGEVDDRGEDEDGTETVGRVEFLDPLGLMDRATKAVMDYDEAVALNGGRNKKREEPFPAPPADEKEAAPATTTATVPPTGRPTYADDVGSRAKIWGPGPVRIVLVSMSLLSCSLLKFLPGQ